MEKQQKPAPKQDNRKLLVVMTVGFITFVFLFMIVNHTSSPTPAKASAPTAKATYSAVLADNCPLTYDQSCWGEGGSVWPVNPADLRVYVQVTNTSSVSGTPSCFVDAQDNSGTYTGYNTQQRATPLNPGGVWQFADDLTVTHQGSQYVTQITLKCDNT